MVKLKKGQRFISEMEPELGLGTVTEIEEKRVLVNFYGSGCQRRYSIENAPLRRVVFKIGDRIETRDNRKLTVIDVRDDTDILHYIGESSEISEEELIDTLSFSSPLDRLLSGFKDNNSLYNLRYDLLKARYNHNKSDVFGFIGGRVELIPHQFYIAHEVSSRYIPRVLLSDEVGLGKTIEACLILHRLILSERIGRVLIVLPESLIHQWFVELFRRFNLTFRIVHNEHCSLLEETDKTVNPFLEDQLILCSYGFFESNEKRREQALGAGWDIILADEAHHIDEETQLYRFFEQLTLKVKGLILITATPEQPGQRSHFSHLRLIDPDRYHNFDTFSKETEKYRDIAEKAETLIYSMDSPETHHKTRDKNRKLLNEMLDCFGPGRAIFRNTRKVVRGFPSRIESRHELFGRKSDVEKANAEFAWDNHMPDSESVRSFFGDLRITFLKQLIEKTGSDKILLICCSLEKSQKIEETLKKIINVKVAQFNENMSLIQRDRNAAWFSEKNGAKLMICSEIGSEGRNFQFSNHLVLFDLPMNPELLEQRIGRLDRIGQTRDIRIHIPYIKGSVQEILVEWYSTGIDIFKKNISGLHHIYHKCIQELEKLIRYTLSGKGISYKRLDAFISSTKEYVSYISDELRHGRNRLLEINSYKPQLAEELISEIQNTDGDESSDQLILELFEHYEIDVDEIDIRTYKFTLDDVSEPEFPVPILKKNGMVVTFDREKAVHREDIDYLSWDHPMVTGSVELFLGTEQGNCALAEIKGPGDPEILLETIFVLECVAPGSLFMQRFLPGTPIRIVVNHLQQDVTEKYSSEFLRKQIIAETSDWVLSYPEILQKLLPQILKSCEDMARTLADGIKQNGLEDIEKVIGREIDRLVALKKMNTGIREDEIKLAEKESDLLKHHMKGARLRLDSLRLIKKETS